MAQRGAISGTGPHATRGGLREAHAHLVALGQTMQRLDLSGCVDVDDCLARVADAADRIRVIHNLDRPGARLDAPTRTHREVVSGVRERAENYPSTPWLIAWGVRPSAWRTPRWPTMHELDGSCSDIPCFLAGFDHHSAVCNSAALSFFGYGEGTPDPAGGTIVRDSGSQPTGLLLESAYTRAREMIPQPTREEARALVKAACESLAAHGFVEVHDLLAQPWLGDVLRELDEAGELPLRVGLFAPMLGAGGIDVFREFDVFARGARAWETSRVRFLGGKLFADGTLNNATAAMLEEYRDPLPHFSRGQLLLNEAELAHAMLHVAGLSVELDRELGLAVHAIGDRAVRTVLDGYQQLSADSRRRVPLRVEHAEVVDAADVPRFGRLGVTASVQPCHLLYDIEALERQLPQRLDRVLPLREFIDSGLVPGTTLLFGSDVPIVRANPEDSIQAAVRRGRAGTSSEYRVSPAQAIPEATAWACFAASRSE